MRRGVSQCATSALSQLLGGGLQILQHAELRFRSRSLLLLRVPQEETPDGSLLPFPLLLLGLLLLRLEVARARPGQGRDRVGGGAEEILVGGVGQEEQDPEEGERHDRLGQRDDVLGVEDEDEEQPQVRQHRRRGGDGVDLELLDPLGALRDREHAHRRDHEQVERGRAHDRRAAARTQAKRRHLTESGRGARRGRRPRLAWPWDDS